MIGRNTDPVDPSALGERIRIVLVAPHPVQRTRLIHMVQSHQDLDIVGVTDNDTDVIRLCPHIQPDVVVVDGWRADMDAGTLAGAVQNQWPWVQILVLDGRTDTRAEQVGSNGSLPDGLGDEHLGTMIRAALAQRNGGPGWSLSGPRLRAFPDHVLSRRQWDVWQALKTGLTDVQIAERLGVNELTARLQVREVLDHLGLASRQDAVIAERADRSRPRRTRVHTSALERRELAVRVRPVVQGSAYHHAAALERSGGSCR